MMRHRRCPIAASERGCGLAGGDAAGGRPRLLRACGARAGAAAHRIWCACACAMPCTLGGVYPCREALHERVVCPILASPARSGFALAVVPLAPRAPPRGVGVSCRCTVFRSTSKVGHLVS